MIPLHLQAVTQRPTVNLGFLRMSPGRLIQRKKGQLMRSNLQTTKVLSVPGSKISPSPQGSPGLTEHAQGPAIRVVLFENGSHVPAPKVPERDQASGFYHLDLSLNVRPAANNVWMRMGNGVLGSSEAEHGVREVRSTVPKKGLDRAIIRFFAKQALPEPPPRSPPYVALRPGARKGQVVVLYVPQETGEVLEINTHNHQVRTAGSPVQHAVIEPG